MASAGNRSIGAERYNRLASAMAGAKMKTLQAVGHAPAPIEKSEYLAWKFDGPPSKLIEEDERSDSERLSNARRYLANVIVMLMHLARPVLAEEEFNFEENNSWLTAIGTTAHLVLDKPCQGGSVLSGVKPIPPSLASRLSMGYIQVVEYPDLSRDEDATPEDLSVLRNINGFMNDVIDELKLGDHVVLTPTQVSNLKKCSSSTQQAAMYALMVYLSGRPIASQTASYLSKRPQNICDKYNSKRPWVDINGSLSPSVEAGRRIGDAWTSETAFRHGYFTPLIRLRGGELHRNTEVIAMIVKLLEYSQLSHLQMIHKFMRMYPFVVDIPELQNEIALLDHDLDIWLSYPPHHQVYAKLLNRDNFSAFDHRQLQNLVKLAVDIIKIKDQSIEGYAVSDAPTEIREAFDAACLKAGFNLPTATTVLVDQAPGLMEEAPLALEED